MSEHMLKNLKLSAPGKLILSGEHAVVYGKKALACAINLRTNLSVSHSESISTFEVSLKDIEKTIQITESTLEAYRNKLENVLNEKGDAFDKLIDYFQNKEDQSNKQLDSVHLMIFGLNLNWSNLKGLKIEIDSEVPLASGLGSSASYSVCLACFFLILSDQLHIKSIGKASFDESELELINKHAFYIEKLFHGKPSGIDNSVATFGNYVLFENGQIKEKFNSNFHLPVLIVNSCVPKQTKEQVLKVRELYNKHTNIIDGLMNAIDEIVNKFAQTLKESINQLETFEDLIILNQGVLFSLQICNYELNKIINIAQAHGCKSKLTGAGGGGCCFVLLKQNTDVQRLISDLELSRFQSFMTQLGCDGIKIENI